MRKLIGGTVVALFALLVSVPAVYAGGEPGANLRGSVVQTSSSLYNGGFMNEVLTRKNPTPWRVVRHYVGNKPGLIVTILKEQGISLKPGVKYPVGMAIIIPQKYVLKELLPTPSAAAVAIAEAEHQAELRVQADKFFAALKTKDVSLSESYGFVLVFLVLLVAAIVVAMSWHDKFTGADATADALDANLVKALENNRRLSAENNELENVLAETKKRYENYVMLASGEKAGLEMQLAGMKTLLDAIVPDQVGHPRSFIDNNGKRHTCLIKRHEWDLQNKVCVVWLQCAYCDAETRDKREDVLKHISRLHADKMSPDPKMGKTV